MRNSARTAPSIACRTYAPVGSHRDLLAYLVRRLLENGANSSFVALAADDAVPVATLLRRPADIIGSADKARHPEHSAAARSLSAAAARIRAGIEFGERAALRRSLSAERSPRRRLPAAAIASPIATPAAGANAAIDRRARARVSRAGAARRPATRAPHSGAGRRPAGAARGAFHRAAAARGRQDARRRALGSARGRRFLPLLCRAGPQAVRRRRGHAGPDRREQCAAPARPRRVRRDLAVEFSAGDLSRPGRGGADGRQCGGRKARRADAADRGGGGAAAARGRRAGFGAASGAGRRPDRRGAGRASRYRRRRVHRLDRGGAHHQPDACGQGRRRSCR